MSLRLRTRLRSLAAVAAAVLLAGAAAAPAAHADGDPPSDVLLVQDVYFPYQPLVSKPIAGVLRKLIARAQRAGFPLKVALVQSDVDLGAIPQLFGKPAQYVTFLSRELTFRTREPLLVVMPAGLAVANVTPAARAAVANVSVSPTDKSDGLARAAIAAVPKLATASGHPVAAVRAPSAGGGSGGGASPLLVYGAPVALVALAALAAALRHRRHDDEEDE